MEAREHEESRLYRSDGSKLYSAEEHAEREADIRRRFRAAMDAIDEEAETLVTAAEESLMVAENADPTDALTTEELASANAVGTTRPGARGDGNLAAPYRRAAQLVATLVRV